jgi:hypothetical protein
LLLANSPGELFGWPDLLKSLDKKWIKNDWKILPEFIAKVNTETV